MDRYFSFLDNQINDLLRVDIGFSTCPAADIYPLQPEVLQGYQKRHELIQKFQDITSDLFLASLAQEADPAIAGLIINELPQSFGWNWHKELHERAREMGISLQPAFFRTDEVVPGKISEIQSPGSLWCQCEQLYSFYEHFSQDFKGKPVFPGSMAGQFARDLKKHLDDQPLVHHLLDNASVQSGMRFFLQRTRDHGVRYFGYDKDVSAYDCNFIRAHAFHGLMSDNYFKTRFDAWQNKRLHYDLPPSIVFDEKIPLIFPFWEKTRDMYPDEIREIFPYTTLVDPENIVLEDGERMDIHEFLQLPRKRRDYFLKYAGCDLDANWGSKGVYSMQAMTGNTAGRIKSLLTEGYKHNRYWILQKSYSVKEDIAYLDRSSGLQETTATAKYSGFYGPCGLMGILVMHRPFYKVHGAGDTIVSIC
ncbi:hypothetical protein [Desulfonatronospira sp. MSAO_Bac3]|uniref:hypothetical protein n=1 Tax=Desulfonatronospira sp. MSAO_Bac3 TaxID=2293857 RepID=UPI000FF0AC22|nr:hypothetical protein [Desulfonatronospira sp. MSAO_Bac3]RQD77923.1 MAG: hypothetical protein D5S03_03500 [Desulfonatronospira sp. MSAO_Bac3]